MSHTIKFMALWWSSPMQSYPWVGIKFLTNGSSSYTTSFMLSSRKKSLVQVCIAELFWMRSNWILTT